MTPLLRIRCAPFRTTAPLAGLLLAGAVLALPMAAAAQATSALLPAASAAPAAGEPASRIARVKLYPGSATVERVARVPAGARSLTFRCLPAGLDAQSLQVQADASVRVGETSVQVLDRAIAGGCASPLDDRVRAAQDQLAAASAESDALELAHTYLKTVANTPPAVQASGPGTPGAGTINTTTETLRRSAQDTLVKLHQAQRRQEAAELALKALTAERDRIAGPAARVALVTVTLAAERDADVRLAYQVRGPSWSPSYRASLDTAAASVRLERLALVAQNTGEDWGGVQLTLSTGQPTRATSGRLPRPWTLDVEPPPQPVPPPAPAPAAASLQRLAAPVAPAPMAEAAEPLPSFDVAVAEGAYATEFAVPQRITVPSGGQRITLALGQTDARAQLLSRTVPAQEEAAYLVAVLPAPAGVWPTAPVALYLDGAFVGSGQLDTAAIARTGLAFGRDERVRVRAEPTRDATGSAGLTGARTERTQQRAYTVDNRHTAPIALQVLDAAPVSQNEQITVESRYEPAPADTAWNQQPGTVLWSQTLAAGASARFTASHTVRYPKDVRLQERR